MSVRNGTAASWTFEPEIRAGCAGTRWFLQVTRPISVGTHTTHYSGWETTTRRARRRIRRVLKVYGIPRRERP